MSVTLRIESSALHYLIKRYNVHSLIIMQAFINYVLGFYGRDGIYDMGATRSMVCDIINTYLVGDVWIVPNHPYGTLSFGYDSTDRELIRDLLIDDYSLVFPD